MTDPQEAYTRRVNVYAERLLTHYSTLLRHARIEGVDAREAHGEGEQARGLEAVASEGHSRHYQGGHGQQEAEGNGEGEEAMRGVPGGQRQSDETGSALLVTTSVAGIVHTCEQVLEDIHALRLAAVLHDVPSLVADTEMKKKVLQEEIRRQEEALCAMTQEQRLRPPRPYDKQDETPS